MVKSLFKKLKFLVRQQDFHGASLHFGTAQSRLSFDVQPKDYAGSTKQDH